MTDVAVTFLLENLSELIVREADLLTGVKEKVEWIENEFQLMVAHLQTIEALPQVPNNVSECVDSSTTVIRRAEDVIETYAKIAAKRNTAAFYKKPFHRIKVRNQSMELEKIKYEIMAVEEQWTRIDFDVIPRPAYFFSGSSEYRDAAVAMKKLGTAALWCGHHPVLKEQIEWVKEELAPLNDFLKKTNEEILELGERQGLWIMELKHIFMFVAEFLTCYNPGYTDQLLELPFLVFLYGRCVPNAISSILLKLVPEIQSRILDLYRRYFTYGIGEIRSSYGIRTISPRIRMSCPIPGSSSSSSSSGHYSISWLLKEIDYLSTSKKEDLNIVVERRLRVDLKLMKALIKDGRSMRDKDERLKVWLNQMEEISVDLDEILSSSSSSSTTPTLTGEFDLDQVEDEICRMAGRKMMYGISSVGADCRLLPYYFTSASAISEAHDHSSTSTTQLLKTFTRELQLMKALFKDVKTHVEPLDARLKIWLQEMQVVAQETEAVVELLSNTPKPNETRARDLRRCQKLNERICTMSRWKHTYSVADVKSRVSSSSFMQHQLGDGEYVEPYPSQDMDNDDDIDLIRREMKLMHALDSDIISKMGELDGTTKAWLQEMRSVAEDALDMLVMNDNLKGLKAVDIIKDRMRDLSEKRVANGIQFKSNSVFDNTQILELIRDHNNTDDINQMQGCSDALDRDNNNPSTLSTHLKQCINHFSLFPRDFEVPARRLKVLWVAEGLVRPKKDETVEHVAERYLQELIHLNLVKVTKRKLNGKVKACQLSDEARDKWLPEAEESRFLKGTRLADHNNCTSTDSVQKYRSVISFSSFDTQEGKKSGERIGKFVDKCIASDCFLELRILDLEQVFRPKLPKSVSKLVRLRYIGLRWTFLEQLPEFVNKLLNLQVLDVKHTYISTLPRSIWSMQYLRHLYLSETYRTRFIDRPSSATCSLTALQTLWGAFVDEKTCVIQGLDTLLDIRKLGLSCRSTSSQPSILMSEQLNAVDRWISNLKYLESLRLKSRDKNGNPSDLHLNPLTNHGKLSTVYLLGKLKPSVVSEFPLNLIDITLSSSELDTDPMSSLEKLPNLVILRLLSKSVVCNRIRSTNKGFPRLKVLKLWMLESLKNWDIEKGAMPCLEDLEIRSCVNLEVLPDGLQHLVTKLQKLKLTLMPEEEFIVKTENTQAELWAKIVHVLEFDPVRNQLIN